MAVDPFAPRQRSDDEELARSDSEPLESIAGHIQADDAVALVRELSDARPMPERDPDGPRQAVEDEWRKGGDVQADPEPGGQLIVHEVGTDYQLVQKRERHGQV